MRFQFVHSCVLFVLCASNAGPGLALGQLADEKASAPGSSLTTPASGLDPTKLVPPLYLQTQPGDVAPGTGRQRSFELPPVTVVGEKSALREEDRVGTYQQPRWTATRHFPGTRVYVIPENQVEVEFWARPTIARDGSTETRLLYELEIGLPYRFQIDLYYRADVEEGDYRNGAQFEMRWALADWGKIPGNPAIYLEYAPLESAPDKIEGRLLFGDQFAPRWHWGLNLNAELETGGAREYEYQISGGVSYTVIDEKFSVGAEAKALFTDTRDNRGTFTDVYLFGPSLQWRPMPQLTINLAPLVGIGPDSPSAEVTLNIGWEF